MPPLTGEDSGDVRLVLGTNTTVSGLIWAGASPAGKPVQLLTAG